MSLYHEQKEASEQWACYGKRENEKTLSSKCKWKNEKSIDTGVQFELYQNFFAQNAMHPKFRDQSNGKRTNEGRNKKKTHEKLWNSPLIWNIFHGAIPFMVVPFL